MIGDNDDPDKLYNGFTINRDIYNLEPGLYIVYANPHSSGSKNPNLLEFRGNRWFTILPQVDVTEFKTEFFGVIGPIPTGVTR